MPVVDLGARDARFREVEHDLYRAVLVHVVVTHERVVPRSQAHHPRGAHGEVAPGDRHSERHERVEHLQLQLEAQIGHVRAQALARIDALAWRLHAQRPQLALAGSRLTALADRLSTAHRARLHDAARRVTTLAEALSHLDPTRVLSRGYGIVRDADGRVVRDAGQVAAGSAISIALSRGRLDAEVVASHGAVPPSPTGDLSVRDKPD